MFYIISASSAIYFDTSKSKVLTVSPATNASHYLAGSSLRSDMLSALLVLSGVEVCFMPF